MKRGDIVCHSRLFLQSTGWLTGVPINGHVAKVNTDGTLVVDWSDGTRTRINPANVVRYDMRHLEPR